MRQPAPAAAGGRGGGGHPAELHGTVRREELSEQPGVTKSHLVRTFKQEIGVSPGKYLTNVRIEAVKALLLSDEYNLEMIADDGGFRGRTICAGCLNGR